MVENLFVKKNPLEDLFSSMNSVILNNVTFKLCYNQIYHMKTTKVVRSKMAKKRGTSLMDVPYPE